MYHIFYHPKGQKSSSPLSITPKDASGDVADHPVVRATWDRMVNTALRTGVMRTDDGVAVDFASLQWAGHLDGQGNGHGGMMCEKWTEEEGLKKIYEPEPKVEVTPEAPEQPEPPAITGALEYGSEALSGIPESIMPNVLDDFEPKQEESAFVE